VHDGAASPLQCLERAHDQVLAGLHEDLHGDILGDLVLLDQPADEVVVLLAGGGKADLDLLEAQLDQQRPHLPLLGYAHRLEQSLVAVAKVDTGPGRCLLDGALWPPAVGHPGTRDGAIFAVVEGFHRLAPEWLG
jgi:hypothetical protein